MKSYALIWATICCLCKQAIVVRTVAWYHTCMFKGTNVPINWILAWLTVLICKWTTNTVNHFKLYRAWFEYVVLEGSIPQFKGCDWWCSWKSSAHIMRQWFSSFRNDMQLLGLIRQCSNPCIESLAHCWSIIRSVSGNAKITADDAALKQRHQQPSAQKQHSIVGW